MNGKEETLKSEIELNTINAIISKSKKKRARLPWIRARYEQNVGIVRPQFAFGVVLT